MTKEQIRHFDDMIIRLRVEGISISLVIIGIGFTIVQLAPNVVIPIINWSAASAMFIFASLYLFPIFLFDMVHFKLLLTSVDYAISLENQYFAGKIALTNTLTSKYLTWLHTGAFYFLYLVIIVIGIVLGGLFISIP